MPRSFPLDALPIDRAAALPLQRQLYLALKRLIEERALEPNGALPSSRSLAQDLALARNTVTAAYDQLVTEGYLVCRRGARPVVVDLPPARTAEGAPDAAPHQPLSRRGEVMMRQPFHHGTPGATTLHPGMPDAGNFPFGLWARLLARRAAFGGDSLFGTYHVTGHPELKAAVAAYLKAARGVRCQPEQIVVTTGAQAALDLLARLLLDPGDTVWMEEPGYYGAQSAFVAAGARLAALRVGSGEGGSAGWSLDPPPHRRLKLIYVTPSCHHPLGGTMRMEQRLRLLEIAEDRRAWLIEDDFDGEYRFQGQPIPAMQGSDRSQRVIYVGTFAKILFPALRMGFMVLPPALSPGIAHALSITGQFAPLLLQAALADFIDQGHMARHLRRMRRIYATRRQALRELCDEHLRPWLTMVPGDAGIQMAGLLAPGLDDGSMAAAARRHGLNVSPLSMHYRHPEPRHGLVIGCAASDLGPMRRSILQLRDAFAAMPD